MKNLVLLLATTILFVSCYTIKYTPITDEMNIWIGKTEHEVILSKGSPNYISEDGAGGKVLNYENTTYNTVSMPAYYYNNSSQIIPGVSSTSLNTSYMRFYVDSVGKVYYWATNIKKVEKVQDPKQTHTATVVAAITTCVIILVAVGSN